MNSAKRAFVIDSSTSEDPFSILWPSISNMIIYMASFIDLYFQIPILHVMNRVMVAAAIGQEHPMERFKFIDR